MKIKLVQSCLENCKQYLNYNNDVTNLVQITCGVPQGSILEPLLFLIYVNYMCNIPNILDPTLFADDKPFLSHQNINTIFKNI